MKIKNDFSWRVWLAVLALHILAFMGIHAALLLRPITLAPMPNLDVQTFIVPSEEAKPKQVPLPTTMDAVARGIAKTHPKTMTERFAPPDSVRLHYTVTKGLDNSTASLTWRRQESSYEATYLSSAVQIQTSVGTVGDQGLLPMRFGDKRRGKSEQATHFDLDKQRITFSNNRPQALLAMGVQDRLSVLIQLASLFAAEPSKWSAGHLIDIPVASASELEVWRFEVQGVGADTHLIRRAARDFDQTLELWLSPSLGFLPTRIRQTDSSGVTDMQLVGQEKL